MKYKVILFTVLLFMLNCKDEKTKKEEIIESTPVETINEKDFFSLTINAIVDYDGDFILYYLEGNQKDITSKNSVSLNVERSESVQKLHFRLKENIIPTKLMLVLKSEQKKQRIKFFDSRLDYYDDEILISAKNFYQFFNPNHYLEYDKDNYVAVAIEKNGQFKPNFFSRKVLDDRIDLIFY